MEAGRSRKQRRAVKQMFADLQALDYGGSYNRVAASARLCHEKRLLAQQTTGRGTFVPLVFGPGEAVQFDWSEDWAVLAGVPEPDEGGQATVAASVALLNQVFKHGFDGAALSFTSVRICLKPAAESGFEGVELCVDGARRD